MNQNTINPQTLCQAISQSNVWKLKAKKKILESSKKEKMQYL